jgi:hypothetical protein
MTDAGDAACRIDDTVVVIVPASERMGGANQKPQAKGCAHGGLGKASCMYITPRNFLGGFG